MTRAMDITGQRFGKLVAIKRVENHRNGGAQWLFQCDCGNTSTATTSSVRARRGNRTSCGCAAFSDLAGDRFGMLTVLERSNPETGQAKVLWRCQCDCGSVAVCSTSNLKGGLSTSCGCVRTKHNGKGTRLYSIMSGMKDRCHNQNSKYWDRYGGRGIKVCDEWRNDFAAFRDWAMANGYADHLTIDRIDNDGGYCPENCQWLTLEENARKNNS